MVGQIPDLINNLNGKYSQVLVQDSYWTLRGDWGRNLLWELIRIGDKGGWDV